MLAAGLFDCRWIAGKESPDIIDMLLERPLVALADAPEAGFFGRLSDSVWLWFKGDQKVEISSTPNTQ